MSWRTIISLIIWNSLALCMWGLLISERPARWVGVVVILLPAQVLLNFAILATVKRFRISALSVIYVLGCFVGLYAAVKARHWWAFFLLPVPLMLAIWQTQADRRRISRK